MNAVEMCGLAKSFGSVQAIVNLDLQIPKGLRFGLVGADGAGKSTLLRMIASLISADCGTLKVLGMDLPRQSRELRSRIGLMPQRFSLYGDLSVWENLQFYGKIFGMDLQSRRSRGLQLLEFVRLEEFKKRRAQNLSGGMKQKLALACALLHQPELLLLDEPTVGVDPVSRQEFQVLLDQLRQDHLTVVMSSPYMDEGQRCDKVAFLHQGRLLEQGKPQDLANQLPWALWEFRSETQLHWPMSQVVPKPFVLIYPQGGALRAMAPRSCSQSEILATLQNSIPNIRSGQQIPGGLEDVLMWNLSRGEHDSHH